MKNSLDVKSLIILVPVIVITMLLAIIGLGHLISPSWVGEQAATTGYFRKTFGLITDAPHATSELVYSTIENVVVLAVGISWGRRALRRQHDELDREHGFTHEDE